MSEQDLRRVLVDAVPPMKAPSDRIEAVGRRVGRQRVWSAVTAGAAGVTLAAAGLAVVLNLGHPVTAQQPPPPVNVGSSSVKDDVLKAQARLEAAVQRSLTRQGATLDGPIVFQYTLTRDRSAAASFALGVLVTANGRHGAFTVTIEPSHAAEVSCAADGPAPGYKAECRDLTGPNGEHMMVMPLTGDGAFHGKPNRASVVRIGRNDGTVVTVAIDNGTKLESEGSFGLGTSEYTGNLPPLTVDQAIAIATDEAIGFYR
jgi:hypothetical protein